MPTVPARAAASEGGVAASTPDAFLTFRLGHEEYGINILRVQEIRSYEPPTRIAGAPSFLLGVVDLRGVVVPVLDMRLRLGLPDHHYDASTVMIVLRVAHRVLGLVVDAVSDVLALSPAQMRVVPALGGGLMAHHLLAAGAFEQRMLLLIDIDSLVDDPAMGLADATSARVARSAGISLGA